MHKNLDDRLAEQTGAPWVRLLRALRPYDTARDVRAAFARIMPKTDFEPAEKTALIGYLIEAKKGL